LQGRLSLRAVKSIKLSATSLIIAKMDGMRIVHAGEVLEGREE